MNVAQAEATEPKLLDRVRNEIRTRHFSIRTEQAHVGWIRRFVLFHGKRHPLEMGGAEIRAFLTYLAVKSKVAASTQNQALSALVFLYRHVLEQPFPDVENVVRAKKPARLPTVFTREEVNRVMAAMHGTHALMASLIYGSGLRLPECLRVRVKDLQADPAQITVRDGKGRKDRVTILPERLVEPLRLHLRTVRRVHRDDLRAGYGDVFLPDALGRKYPRAGTSWGWQYVFPAAGRSVDPRSGQECRHDVSEDGLQRAVRAAVRRADITKHGSCHTFRHSFATHLLEAGYFRPHRAGVAGARGRAHHHDLHARPQSRRTRGAQPAGYGVKWNESARGAAFNRR